VGEWGEASRSLRSISGGRPRDGTDVVGEGANRSGFPFCLRSVSSRIRCRLCSALGVQVLLGRATSISDMDDLPNRSVCSGARRGWAPRATLDLVPARLGDVVRLRSGPAPGSASPTIAFPSLARRESVAYTCRKHGRPRRSKCVIALQVVAVLGSRSGGRAGPWGRSYLREYSECIYPVNSSLESARPEGRLRSRGVRVYGGSDSETPPLPPICRNTLIACADPTGRPPPRCRRPGHRARRWAALPGGAR